MSCVVRAYIDLICSTVDDAHNRTTHAHLPLRFNDILIRGAHIGRAGRGVRSRVTGGRRNRTRGAILRGVGQGYVSPFVSRHLSCCVTGMLDTEVPGFSADTLFVCYCIDKDTGMKHREEVFSAVSRLPWYPTPFTDL